MKVGFLGIVVDWKFFLILCKGFLIVVMFLFKNLVRLFEIFDLILFKVELGVFGIVNIWIKFFFEVMV